jgi:hypothetical protein
MLKTHQEKQQVLLKLLLDEYPYAQMSFDTITTYANALHLRKPR